MLSAQRGVELAPSESLCDPNQKRTQTKVQSSPGFLQPVVVVQLIKQIYIHIYDIQKLPIGNGV